MALPASSTTGDRVDALRPARSMAFARGGRNAAQADVRPESTRFRAAIANAAQSFAFVLLAARPRRAAANATSMRANDRSWRAFARVRLSRVQNAFATCVELTPSPCGCGVYVRDHRRARLPRFARRGRKRRVGVAFVPNAEGRSNRWLPLSGHGDNYATPGCRSRRARSWPSEHRNPRCGPPSLPLFSSVFARVAGTQERPIHKGDQPGSRCGRPGDECSGRRPEIAESGNPEARGEGAPAGRWTESLHGQIRSDVARQRRSGSRGGG